MIALTAHSFTFAGDKGFLTVRRLKRSAQTRQPLIRHPNALLDEAKALFEFVPKHHDNQRLFPISRVQLWRVMQRYARTAGVARDTAHPHALKHTIARETIEKAGIENVRQWLGHKVISSTGFYLRKTDDEAAEAVRRAHGLIV